MSAANALFLLLILIVLSVPISFIVRCVWANFSPTLRENIRQHKLREIIWIGASIFIVAGLVVVPINEPYQGAAARKAEVGTMMNQIQVAAMAYYNDYSVLPQVSTNADFVKIVWGDNPRKIEYLQLHPQALNAQGEIVDPWGTPYRIWLADPNHLVVWSAGPDKEWNTADDIKSSSGLTDTALER